MDPEHWHRLSDLFRQALEREPEQRALFLDAVSADDPSLGAELVSLLAYHDQTAGFLDTATHLVGGPANAALNPPVTESLVGRRLSHYR